MTALNHVATGAVIALTVKVPGLAIPLSLVSHYACDALPHFGIYEEDHVRRNAHWLFKTVTILSVIGMCGMLVVLPYYESNIVSPLTVIACMVVAILPDIVWIPLYIREVRSGQEEPLNQFDQLHQAIQWYEKPLGLALEMAWLSIAMYLLSVTLR